MKSRSFYYTLVYTLCKERGLGKEIPTDWFLQDIRD